MTEIAGPDGNDWPDLAGRLTAAGHVLPVRVYYEDTDFSGAVYHAGYLRFLERGRTDYLRLLGVEQRRLAEGGGDRLGFVVRRMEIDFLKPARMDDLLEVVTEPATAEGARLVLRQRATRAGRTLVDARVTVAAVGAEGRPRRLPAELRQRLLPLAGGTGAVTDP